MFDNPVVVITVVEIAVAALFLIGSLLYFIRGQRRTLGALEAKIIALRDALRGARAETKAARAAAENPQAGAGDFGEILEEQIVATRNHHLAMNPDRDIVLDISPDTPLERRAASLRHAFLIAEKEAWSAADGKEVDWDVLNAKLAQIIEFHEQAAAAPEIPGPEADMLDAFAGESESLEALAPEPQADAGAELEALRATVADQAERLADQGEQIANQERHIASLERFKTLFFATDDKWRAASEQAEAYHQELLQKSRDAGVDAEYQALLAKYGSVYDDVGAAFAAERGTEPAPRAETQAVEIDTGEPSVGRIVIANQEEIQRLRNMAVDQHKMILRLREELTAAQSSEEKDRVITELHKQLERHERFLRESDVCTKQLENELDRVLQENHGLKIKLRDGGASTAAPADDANVEQMVKIIEDFTEQSSEMLNAIEALESECSDLRAKLDAGAGGRAGPELEAARSELAAVQQELQALQTQHVELEERYLELKLKAG